MRPCAAGTVAQLCAIATPGFSPLTTSSAALAGAERPAYVRAPSGGAGLHRGADAGWLAAERDAPLRAGEGTGFGVEVTPDQTPLVPFDGRRHAPR